MRKIKVMLNSWKKIYYYLYNQLVANCNPQNYNRAGDYVQIGENQICQPSLITMDSWTRLQNNNNVISQKGTLEIRKYAAIGSGCIIIPDKHVPTVGMPQFLSITHINDVVGKIIVNEDAWVGAGSILVSNCEIGRGAIIGAGSVVTKKIPPYAVVVGSPAKIIATRFNIEQIIRHEAILYPPQERISKKRLEEIFNQHFNGKPSIGTSQISEKDKMKLEKAKAEFGIKDFSNL